MRKFFPIMVVIVMLLSGLGVVGSSNINPAENEYYYVSSIDDISSLQYLKAREGNLLVPDDEPIQKTRLDYQIGDTIWQYTLTIYDPSPKAIAPIQDINEDGIDDVIVCSEDDHVRCFSGGAIDTGEILWEHEISAGDVYNQNGLSITEDIDGDGFEDVVVGAAWGARLIRCISGKDGDEIWTHDTHEYGGGGWVYMVDCSYDYNDDDVIDVLANTGDDSSDNGPKRVYCLDGEDGTSIWECPVGGPGFSVIGIEDFTGDGHPDVLAGCSNEAETTGYAKGINGDTGSVSWTFTAPGSSVWALEQIDDVSGDGIKDVIIGDFSGNIRGLDATNGDIEYTNSVGTAIITRFAKLNDVNSDGHPDVVPAHSSIHTTQLIDGQTGSFIWTHSVADQPWNVARIADVSGDAIDDVLVGTLFSSNYCYFLDGTDGSELESVAYGQAVDAIAAIPDVVNDGSMEMMAGGRDGKVTCISGGLDAFVNDPPKDPAIDGPSLGAVGYEYEFSFVSTDPDGDDVFYYIEWGDETDNDWIGPYPSGEEILLSHTWNSPDDYEIRVKAKDTSDEESQWSVYPVIIVVTTPPNAPDISGTSQGKPGESYNYYFTSTDPEGDDVSYYIEWGDGETTDWTSYQASGVIYKEDHEFSETGTFVIRAKAKDVYGIESDWRELDVSMPRNILCKNTFLIRLLQRFPNAFPLFRKLIGL